MIPLDEYSQTLLTNLQGFQKLGNVNGAGMIRASCVDCLAHLIVLCETLRKVEPTLQMKLDNLCDSTLEWLGALDQDMCMGEYIHLDLLLEVWSSRNGQTNIADGEHRIGRKSSQVSIQILWRSFRMPNFQISTLATRAKLEDNSTEISWH